MNRRMLTILLAVLFGASLTGVTSLSAQVFPEKEMLDVVRISDGSVLRGKIIENFHGRHVKIEIYGGSVFVIAYENIESISEEPNPDYNTRWIKVEIGELPDAAEDSAARR